MKSPRVVYPEELNLLNVERYSKEYWRIVNLRKKFKRTQQGKCRGCGVEMNADKKWWDTIVQRPSEFSARRVCEKCRKRRSRCRSAKRADYRDRGLCSECGNPPASGKKLCDLCRTKAAKQRDKRYRNLKLSGRCISCTKKFTNYDPSPRSPAYCDDCLLQQKIQRLSKRRRKTRTKRPSAVDP